MSACDPLIQAERRFNAILSGSKQVGLFPCRGPAAPCRTLPPVSALAAALSNPRRTSGSGNA